MKCTTCGAEIRRAEYPTSFLLSDGPVHGGPCLTQKVIDAYEESGWFEDMDAEHESYLQDEGAIRLSEVEVA